MAFFRAQRQHGFVSRFEKTFTFDLVGLAIHDRMKATPHQICDLGGSVSGQHPGVSRNTGICRSNRLAIAQVVVFVDVVQKQDSRLGKVIGGTHHRVPQLPRGQGLVDPLTIIATSSACIAQRHTGPGPMNQLPVGIGQKCLHESVGHADRYIEVIPSPRRTLGSDELEYVGVVNAQHAHLGTPTGACALYGGAGLIKHIDIAARARRYRCRRLDLGPTRAYAGKVVAHATATAHGLGRLTQCLVNAGKTAVVHTLNAVTHGLHKTVDERGLNVGACRAHDAPRANGT